MLSTIHGVKICYVHIWSSYPTSLLWNPNVYRVWEDYEHPRRCQFYMSALLVFWPSFLYQHHIRISAYWQQLPFHGISISLGSMPKSRSKHVTSCHEINHLFRCKINEIRAPKCTVRKIVLILKFPFVCIVCPWCIAASSVSFRAVKIHQCLYRPPNATGVYILLRTREWAMWNTTLSPTAWGCVLGTVLLFFLSHIIVFLDNINTEWYPESIQWYSYEWILYSFLKANQIRH